MTEEVAKVIKPTLSRPSAMRPMNPSAAFFRGVQEPEVWSEPERSITRTTFISRRVAVAVAATRELVPPNQRRNKSGTLIDASTFTVREEPRTVTTGVGTVMLEVPR